MDEGKNLKRLLPAAFAIMALLPGPASGEAGDGDVVKIHVAYLDGPTEWCPADAGVPAVMTADGPAVFVGVEIAERSEVEVRRGVGITERVEVGRPSVSQTRIRRGVDTQIVRWPFRRTDEATLLGRLRVDIEFCQSFASQAVSSGTWRILAPDGTVVRTGNVEQRYMDTWHSHPLFGYFRRFPAGIELGGQKVIVMREPETVRTMEAFVSVPGERAQ